jgi:osmotically inducible protein OsmC
MKRTASAVWQGDLKSGKGALTTDSGVLSNTPYSFATRFGDNKGTNPEELIAAAHAGCFTMALSAQLVPFQLVAPNFRKLGAEALPEPAPYRHLAQKVGTALGNAGITAERLATTATLTMEKLEKGWTITAIHLDLKAKIPGASRTAFDAAAAEAKANCPVSRVLNAKITLDTAFEP